MVRDETLVAEILEGSVEAFVTVYERHARSVAAHASAVVGRDLADDVVQDVFAGLLRDGDRFDPARGTLRTFLLLRCHGRAIDLLRSEASMRRRDGRYARSGSERCTSSLVESAVCDLDLAVEIENSLALLPDCEREALALAFFSGLSYRSAADRLGVPEGTAKSRIRSGLRRLRPLLESRVSSA